MTDLRPVRGRYRDRGIFLREPNEIVYVLCRVLRLITSDDGLGHSYARFEILTNAARGVAKHLRHVGFTFGCGPDRGFQVAIPVHPQHLSFPRPRFLVTPPFPFKEARIVVRCTQETRKEWAGLHNEQSVSGGDASDGMHEALASHALSLKVRWFLSGRDGDNLEIVDQDFEVTRLLFTLKAESLKIAEERAQCGILHSNVVSLGGMTILHVTNAREEIVRPLLFVLALY